MERSGNFYKAIRLGYILISILIGCMAYNSLYEWQEIEALELGNKKIDELRKEINNINIQMIKFSLLGETILEWNDKDIEHYHARRMAMDSMLCRFKATYPAERIDSVRSLLEDKERQMFQIVRLMDEQQSINKKIANQIPVIVQKSVQEQSKKPKRKGFLGIFGKKKEVTPAVSTTILHSVNRNVISEQKVQGRQLSEQADSLAARNAELNRQLQELICQIEEKVQTELQSRENEIVAMREKSFMQVGGLMGFVLLLLLISYIIIHRDAKSIKQYKHKTTDLIRQLEQSVQRNEALITSRKKAVHTITHELRTPLTAITGYAGLIRKEQCEDKSGQYIQNILQSSDRMRDMLNTLLDFFRLDNGKSLMLALSQDLSQNRPAEAREHVRRFHEMFFTLSPEKSAIEHNVKRALLLADKSVYHYYSDFAEKGYYNRIIAGNINQVLKVDSVVCDFNAYPYRAVTYATQKIIRQSNVTERSLVTTCRLLNASRSDDNPNGFTIEGFTIIENKDLQTIKR